MLEGVLASVLNRFLAAYVDGLNTSQLNVGIWSGDVKLKNLRLKTSALDKFRLPIDVKEGYLGDLTLSIPWSNLKGKPVRVLVENVFLLAAPKSASAEVDEDEEEQRSQAVKQEKLANAELLGRDAALKASDEDSSKSESFTQSLVTKIVDNLQITVRNIHIRYEDALSNPEHPFSAGITLAEFSAVSTDSDWNPTFIQHSAQGIHKLARLESLAVYWDTDSASLAGNEIDEAQRKFNALIARDGNIPDHQFILKPVSGAGRLVMRRMLTNEIPKLDAQLLFDELGFALDDEQYRDLISVTDLFHFYTRQAQYKRFRPTQDQLEENRARALLRFAGQAIVNEVHEKHRVWSWEYFRERRDDRKKYVELFKEKQRATEAKNQQQAAVSVAQASEGSDLDALERKLEYKDIRFYRSIARHELRKEREAERKNDAGQEEANQGQASGGWLGWIWGGGHSQQEKSDGVLNAEQRKELYEAIEWDESNAAPAITLDLPRDAMKLRLTAKLQTGSFSLRDHRSDRDILSLVFDSLQADVLQRVDNLEAAISLGGLKVYDGTSANSLYPQIVRVKDEEFSFAGRKNSAPDSLKQREESVQAESNPDDPFFYLKFENKPLDERADNALTLRLRSMEIIYHRGYIESIVKFFEPPESELELIGALMDVAGETIEGIRKQTRAGLESALEHHKTIDMNVDVKAPIIIVPEDVTRRKCQHMVLDAGRISVTSLLVEKKAMDTVRAKTNQAYTEEDYQRLEDLMYDRFFVKLEAAQLIMGNDLKSCLAALSSDNKDFRTHLLERINLDFTIHNSILPKAPNLTKFKISGHLPKLRINFSDRKYKTLMRIIDVAIPFPSDEKAKEDNKPAATQEAPATLTHSDSAALDLNKRRRQKLAGQLRRSEAELLVEDLEEMDEEGDDFQDAEDATADKINAHQKTFELNFSVDRLEASIFKSSTDPSKPDKLLVEASFEGFFVDVSVFPYHLDVDVGLRSLDLEDKIIEHHGDQFRYLITSRSLPNSTNASRQNSLMTSTSSSVASSPRARDLVYVKYTRVDETHPEFMTKYEGIDQSINVELSTINLTVTRASILVAYDWIMTTFVPDEPAPAAPSEDRKEPLTEAQRSLATADPTQRKEKLRVRVKLNSVVLRLNNDGIALATLTLSTADVAVMLRGESIRVAARLGSLTLTDDVNRDFVDPSFAKLLAIEGDELADFTYETFDPSDGTSYPGYDCSIWLRTGSLKFTFMEEPIRELLQFFNKFAQMKAIYDAATLAASTQATQLQQRVLKMHYDIVIKTPIVVLPRDPRSPDLLVANLGEIYAHNTFHDSEQNISVTKVEAGLRHIRLASKLRLGSQEYRVQMIDDVNLSVDVTLYEGPPRQDQPDTQINARMSDVNILLTEHQYRFVMDLTQSVSRTFAVEEDSVAPVSAAEPKKTNAVDGDGQGGAVDMLPELGTVAHQDQEADIPLHTTLDLLFTVHGIHLELFTALATSQESLANARLARFAINDTEVKLKMLADSSLEAEVALKSFTVHDVRPEKETKFREIVPAIRHDGHQFMLSYSQSANHALALITIDSPKIIFSLDPMFALLNFAMSAFPSVSEEDSPETASKPKGKASTTGSTTALARTDKKGAGATAVEDEYGEPALAYRVNVVAPTIVLLASPDNADSEAIVLSIKQVLMSQQGIMALTIDQFGVFMCRMNKPKDTVRFLDNFNLTFSMDSRASALRQMTSIEIDVEPLILRVAYRDVTLITSVINKAIELSAQNNDNQPVAKTPRRQSSMATAQSLESGDVRAVATQQTGSKSATPSAVVQKPTTAQVMMSKEILKASFTGLQVILIGDVHSLPLIDMNLGKFSVNAQDWSADLRVESSLNLYINYYNLSRSHWEPFIDPWTMKFFMSNNTMQGEASSSMTMSSKRRLELNVTSTLIETAMTSMAIMNDDTARSNAYRNAAPFKVRNRTGYKISIWAEHEDRQIKPQAQHLEDGAELPWRFDDWKSMREHGMGSQGNMLSLQVDGMPWERLKHISVDREGEFVLNLRPKLDQVAHRLLFEVKLQDNVKVITFRSTFKIENHTLVPIEVAVVDAQGEPTEVIRKIGPSEDCPAPIEAAYHNRIRIRPDPGFDYGWSEEALHWTDLVKRSTRTVTCLSEDSKEAPFRFQCYTSYDKQDQRSRHYPRLSFKLRAPVEVENLLPYDIQYRLFDKNLNHNWSSYLRKGGVSPIHVVELSHLLLLSIDVQSKSFAPSEFAIIATDNPDDFPVEKFLTLTDKDGLKLQLRLHYIKYPDSGGAFKVQIYSPYIFINQTGIPFGLKTKSWMGVAKLVAGQTQESKDPEPFLFSQSSNDRRNRMLLKVGDSTWSKPLSFEAIGSETEVTIPSPTKNEEIHVGLTIEDGLGKFKLSKVVKLTPRYLIRNHLGEALNLREAGAADFISVEPGKRAPLHFLRVGAAKQVTLAYPGLNNKWTAPFNIEDIGVVHLRIAKAGHHQHLIKVDVMLEGPTMFISLREENGPWPFMLRNESDYTITFAQAAESQDASGQMSSDEAIGKKYELKPRSKMKYAWDYPALPDKLVKLVIGGRERNVNILEIGSLLPFKFANPEGRGSRVVSIDVRADGPTQTLVISNYSESTSNFRLTRQNSAYSRSDTISSAKESGFEAVDVDVKILSSFNVELEGVGISLINRNVQELAYISFRGMEVHYTESDVTTAINLICKWIQIDNQLFGGLFPIVLYPTVLPKDGKDLEVHPTLQASLIRLKDQSHGVMHIKYASVLLQEITVELDEDFLFAVYDFSKLDGASWQQSAADQTDFIENPRSIAEPKSSQVPQDDIYYEILHLQPIALNLSFMRTERVNADERVSSRNPMIFFINALTMALGNVNEAPVRLNALVIENVRLSRAVLLERITYHYGQGFLLQLYRVLGSADFLGNPVGLFNNVSSGVADIFYEPYQGLVMHGNKDLGLGIARGASSFVKKTVFGVTDSVSKVTGSIGKGLAAATMDQEFQSRRRMSRFRNKPKHALYGIATGANSFFTSVASGFEGLALKPLEGAEQGGAGGFLKGVGKGLVGAITKPAVGVFDLASNVTEGMRNTTLVFDQNDIDRVRLPRFVASDGIVRPYSDREALGQTWLKNVDNGRFMKEHYVAHVDVGGHEGDSVVMLTVNRILYVRTLRLKIAWDVPLSELSSISLESQGIALLLRGDIQGPYLQLPDTSTRTWFFKQLSRIVSNYNARHAGDE